MEMIFDSHANKTHFHIKGCVLGLTLKVGDPMDLELGNGLLISMSLFMYCGECCFKMYR